MGLPSSRRHDCGGEQRHFPRGARRLAVADSDKASLEVDIAVLESGDFFFTKAAAPRKRIDRDFVPRLFELEECLVFGLV